MRPSLRIALPLAGAVLALDQATKLLVQATIAPREAIPLIPGYFDLVHVLNLGAAFGFLNQEDLGWQRWFFIAASLLACGVIFWLLHSEEGNSRLGASGLGLVLGGALGNLVDRVRTGLVVDFLDFHVDAWHWPAFNVADMGISCGVLLLIASMYGQGRRRNRRD